MAYITKEEVASIRKELKAKFPTTKFSVRKLDGGLSVNVSIMKGPHDFSEIVDSDGYASVNEYHLDDYDADEWYGDSTPMFAKVLDIIKTAPGKIEGGTEYFDKSDIMTDYFHVAYYYNIVIGSWDKPYEMTS